MFPPKLLTPPLICDLHQSDRSIAAGTHLHLAAQGEKRRLNKSGVGARSRLAVSPSTLRVQKQLSSTLIDSLYLASRLAAAHVKLIERLCRLLSPSQGRRPVASRQALGHKPSKDGGGGGGRSGGLGLRAGGGVGLHLKCRCERLLLRFHFRSIVSGSEYLAN